MPLSTFLDDELLRWLTKGEAFPTPPALYVALFTTTPSKSSAGTEVTGNNYSRVLSLAAHWNVAAVTPRRATNTAPFTFGPPSPSAWGTIAGFGLFDAASSGNLLYYGAVAAPLATVAGQTVTFQIGALQIAGA